MLDCVHQLVTNFFCMSSGGRQVVYKNSIKDVILLERLKESLCAKSLKNYLNKPQSSTDFKVKCVFERGQG